MGAFFAYTSPHIFPAEFPIKSRFPLIYGPGIPLVTYGFCSPKDDEKKIFLGSDVSLSNLAESLNFSCYKRQNREVFKHFVADEAPYESPVTL